MKLSDLYEFQQDVDFLYSEKHCRVIPRIPCVEQDRETETERARKDKDNPSLFRTNCISGKHQRMDRSKYD